MYKGLFTPSESDCECGKFLTIASISYTVNSALDFQTNSLESDGGFAQCYSLFTLLGPWQVQETGPAQ